MLWVVMFALLLATPASAIEFSGQYSNLIFQTRDSLGHYRTTDLNRLRLQTDGEQGDVRFHLVYDHDILWGALVADPIVNARLRRPDATWLDASATLRQSKQTNWQHKVYRAWLSYEVGDFSFKAGRQRIAWGSGRIWNPTDRFNPVQPTALEPDQKLGVDAALVQWDYDQSGSVLAVATQARAAYNTAQKLALRWQDTWDEFDVAITAARIADETMFGLDVTGNMADAGVRLEWMQARNPREGAYGQVAIGLDYTWYNGLFPNGLYAAIEYFYNGAAGLLAKSDRFNGISNHLLAGQLGYDVMPLWRVEMLLIADVQRSGWFVAPAITWSAAENIDMQALAQLPLGRSGSEFFRFEPVYAMRVDWYF